MSLKTRTAGPARKATNITLPAELIAECRAVGLNLSQACEAALRAQLRQLREQRWRAEHAEFIAAYNLQAEQEGLPLDEFRAF